jgi:hypothetical protein
VKILEGVRKNIQGKNARDMRLRLVISKGKELKEKKEEFMKTNINGSCKRNGAKKEGRSWRKSNPQNLLMHCYEKSGTLI